MKEIDFLRKSSAPELHRPEINNVDNEYVSDSSLENIKEVIGKEDQSDEKTIR